MKRGLEIFFHENTYPRRNGGPLSRPPHFYRRVRCWYAEKVFSRWHWANISEFIKYRGEAIGKSARDRVKNVEMMERNTRFLREQRWERTEAKRFHSIRIATPFIKLRFSVSLLSRNVSSKNCNPSLSSYFTRAFLFFIFLETLKATTKILGQITCRELLQFCKYKSLYFLNVGILNFNFLQSKAINHHHCPLRKLIRLYINENQYKINIKFHEIYIYRYLS